MSETSDECQRRLEKLQELKQKGQDPFGYHSYQRTHSSRQLQESFAELEGQVVSVAGRLIAMRSHGKSTFADLQDGSGTIQIHARVDVLGEELYEDCCGLDLGDIVGVSGELFATRTGEVTIRCEEFVLLAKALRALPEKFHGLQDPELRYRQRYLDLLTNEQIKEVFTARSRIIKAARDYLTEHDFLEVETPVLQPIYGGAAARPFITHHNTLDMQLYMRIAPELYLKRLIIGGCERVFEIGRVFRNEGIDTRHNPEFTILEAYQAYADYEDMMTLTENLVAAMCQAVHGGLTFTYQNNEIDLSPPWQRMPLIEAIKAYSGVELTDLADTEAARRQAIEAGLEPESLTDQSVGYVIGKLCDRFVQPNLIQPTFITDYPVSISPLAKRKPDNPQLTARFEPFIGGEEVGNAFSELNDPLDQRQRFEAQVAARAAGDEEAHPLDEEFVQALEYGMPPTGGLGLGIDRLVMLLTDQPNLREVILFPLLRPVNNQP